MTRFPASQWTTDMDDNWAVYFHKLERLEQLYPFAVWTSVDDDDMVVGRTHDAVDAYVLAARDPGIRWVTVGSLTIWDPRDSLSETTRDALRVEGGIEAAFARVECVICSRLHDIMSKSSRQLTRETPDLTLDQAIRARATAHAALRCCSRQH